MEKMRTFIWSNSPEHLDYEQYKKDLELEYPDPDYCDGDRYEIMLSDNDYLLEDVRSQLNKEIKTDIVVIANLGLWDGHHSGCKILNSKNLKDCLYSECDYCTWYVDENYDFKCTAEHHDGTNEYTYRTFKIGTTERRKQNFINKVMSGKATRKDILNYTFPLGGEVENLLGC